MSMESPIIYIFGPLPPPYGGISNHIIRLLPLLKRAGLECHVINQYSHSKVAVIASLVFRLLRGDAVHVHLFSKFLLVLIYIAQCIKTNPRVVLTIHNDRLVGKRIWRFLVSRSDFRNVLVVSKRAAKYWAKKVNNVQWLPAFIPLANSELKLDEVSTTRLIANIWSYYDTVFFDYGIDRLLHLSQKYPQTPVILYVGDETSCDKVEQMLPARHPLQIHYGLDLIAQMKSGDIFLRLNRVDAYGVSVDEALSLGIPAVASDVCERAGGATIFHDIKELEQEVDRLLNLSIAERRQAVRNSYQSFSSADKLIQIYRALT